MSRLRELALKLVDYSETQEELKEIKQMLMRRMLDSHNRNFAEAADVHNMAVPEPVECTANEFKVRAWLEEKRGAMKNVVIVQAVVMPSNNSAKMIDLGEVHVYEDGTAWL
jgi:adenosylcobinamide amidohydrolase